MRTTKSPAHRERVARVEAALGHDLLGAPDLNDRLPGRRAGPQRRRNLRPANVCAHRSRSRRGHCNIEGLNQYQSRPSMPLRRKPGCDGCSRDAPVSARRDPLAAALVPNTAAPWRLQHGHEAAWAATGTPVLEDDALEASVAARAAMPTAESVAILRSAVACRAREFCVEFCASQPRVRGLAVPPAPHENE